MPTLRRGLEAIPENQRSRDVEIDSQSVELAQLAQDMRYSFYVSPTLGTRQPVIWRDDQEKRCAECFAFKLSDEFSQHNGRVDGLQTRCKRCHQVGCATFGGT